MAIELKLPKMPWYAPVGVAVALLVIIAAPGLAIPGMAGKVGGLFFYLYEDAAQTENAKKDTELKKLQNDNVAARREAARLPEFQAEVASLEAQLAKLKESLPEEKDAAELLRGLATLATQSNLIIKSFRPAPAPVPKQLHSEWQIALELEGSYHNLATFFDRVGKMTRIINISGLDVRTHPMPEGNVSIAASCTATTFVLLEKPNPPPAAAGRGGRGA